MTSVSSQARTNYLSRAVRLAMRLYRVERDRLAYRRVEKQYAHRAFDKTIDWDWSAIRYNRVAVLNALAARKPDAAYLEIGCFRNEMFDALPLSKKVGVDPEQGGTIRATSDAFFASNTERFDLIFIDGEHSYDQVHRDVANALKAINPGGWIALHDMLPRNWIEQHNPPVRYGAWCGDGWKVAFELMQTEGIDFRIVKVDHGVGVIRVEKPGTDLADLGQAIGDAQFPYFYENHPRLPLVSWEEALPWMRRA